LQENWSDFFEVRNRILVMGEQPFLMKAKGRDPPVPEAPSPDTKRSEKLGRASKETETKSPRKDFEHFAERIVLKGSSSLSMKLFSNKPFKDVGKLAGVLGDSFMKILVGGEGPSSFLKGMIVSQIRGSTTLRAYLLDGPVQKMELQIDVDKSKILSLKVFRDGVRFELSTSKVPLSAKILTVKAETKKVFTE
jgi:hypothetical protein